MRVLYFHQHFSTPQGATGNRSYEQARSLVSMGHSVHMVCGSYQVANTGIKGTFVRGRRDGIVDGIEITEFEIPYKNSDGRVKRAVVFLKFALKSAAIALRANYDVLFATSTPLTAGIPGILAATFLRKKFVFEVRDLWPELPRAMGAVTNPIVLLSMSALEWCSYRSATLCVGLSPGMVEGIRRRASSRTPVVMIPNGCDMAMFAEVEGLDFEILGVEPGDFVAIFPGAHGLANGLQAVLDAAEVLQSSGEAKIKFVFVGAGGEKERLVSRASDQCLKNCLFFDAVPKPVLASYLARADVGLMVLANIPAFYYGTSPNKFFDYLASGLPVVVNYPGWVANIVNEENLGIVVPPDNAVAFADALVSLKRDSIMTKKRADNSKRVAINSFDRRDLSARFVDVIEAVHDERHNEI